MSLCVNRDTQKIASGYSQSNIYNNKFLGVQVFDTLEYFGKTKEYNEIGLLFSSVWEKLGNKNTKFRTSNSKLKAQIT